MPFVRAKTGIPTLLDASKVLCRALSKFAPYIRTLYPDNTALQAALDAAEAACSALTEALEAVRDYGD
jgi:hypothetical protein